MKTFLLFLLVFAVSLGLAWAGDEQTTDHGVYSTDEPALQPLADALNTEEVFNHHHVYGQRQPDNRVGVGIEQTLIASQDGMQRLDIEGKYDFNNEVYSGFLVYKNHHSVWDFFFGKKKPAPMNTVLEPKEDLL